MCESDKIEVKIPKHYHLYLYKIILCINIYACMMVGLLYTYMFKYVETFVLFMIDLGLCGFWYMYASNLWRSMILSYNHKQVSFKLHIYILVAVL